MVRPESGRSLRLISDSSAGENGEGEAGLVPRIGLEIGSTGAMRAAVRRGAGLAILPEAARKGSLDGLLMRLLLASDPDDHRPSQVPERLD